MASSKEIQSMILKFDQLWKQGYEAELQIKRVAGKATENLKLDLGFAINTQQFYDNATLLKKYVALSRLHRRIKRGRWKNSRLKLILMVFLIVMLKLL